MAATAIWKDFGLEEEYHRIIGNVATNIDVYPTGEGRRVVSATNVFATDKYKIPPGADSKVIEFYPRLAELSKESCFISESVLRNMASDIVSRKAHVSTPLKEIFKPLDKPFSLESPTTKSREETKKSPPLEQLNYKNLDFLENETSCDYWPHESADRIATRPSYGPISNGNIFDGDSVRSRLFPRTSNSDRPLLTPSQKKDDIFDFQDEFLSAFKPDVGGENDYAMLETPVLDKVTRKIPSQNLETLVSPFPWEKSLETLRSPGQRCTPKSRVGEANENLYPSYISHGLSHIPNISARRRFTRVDDPLNLFDSKPPRDFSARSPIRSLMRDSEHSYGYNNTRYTPKSLYRNLL